MLQPSTWSTHLSTPDTVRRTDSGGSLLLTKEIDKSVKAVGSDSRCLKGEARDGDRRISWTQNVRVGVGRLACWPVAA